MSRLSIVSKIAAATTAIAAVGGGVYLVGAQNTAATVSSFTSNAPTVSTPTSASTPRGGNHKGKGHHKVPEHAVITYYSNKTAGDVTITEDSGTLTAVSATSISLTHTDGTTATVPLTSTTHFGRVSLTQLETDISSTTPTRVLVIEKGGSALRVVELGGHKLLQTTTSGG